MEFLGHCNGRVESFWNFSESFRNFLEIFEFFEDF